MNNILSIRNYTKRYGSKVAVDNLSIEIEPGKIYGFIGHNGAGKTTTLKACAGILAFDEGEIYIDGLSIKEHPLECKKMMAYIPDNPDLYGFLSGIKYLNFVADVYGVPEKERQEKVEKFSAIYGIDEDLNNPISSYSHGMRQKIAIISALMHEPKLMIMDEPFVGLDPKASYNLKQQMRETCDKGGAIFFSTHVLEVAEKICDEIAIIKKGKMIVNGTVDEVKGNSSLEDVFLELEE